MGRRDIQLLPLNEDTDTDDASDVADTSLLLSESSSSQSKLKTPSLFVAIARAFAREFLFQIVLKFIQDVLMFANPLLLQLERTFLWFLFGVNEFLFCEGC